MTGRPRTASDRAIFEAISEVIAESGPTGLTLGAVAGRVGVSAPALTQRFGTKRQMLLAYADASTGSAVDIFEAARRSMTSPMSMLYRALLDFAGPATSRKGMANNLAFLQLDLSDAEFGALAAQQSAEVRRQIRDLLRGAVEAGEIASGAPPDALADVVYTTYNGALITWAIDGTGPLERWLSERLDAALAPHLPS